MRQRTSWKSSSSAETRCWLCCRAAKVIARKSSEGVRTLAVVAECAKRGATSTEAMTKQAKKAKGAANGAAKVANGSHPAAMMNTTYTEAKVCLFVLHYQVVLKHP